MDITKKEHSALSRAVMRRVYAIYAMRLFASPAAFKAYAIAAAVWQAGRYASFEHIFKNAPSLFDIAATLRFYVSAFAETEMMMRIIAVFAIALLLWLVRDVARIFSRAGAYELARLS